jgi:ABC-type multidrug transport system ATPase subunit
MVVKATALQARRGEFVLAVAAFAADAHGTVILGPNGAGKTTLLLALQGLIPSAGTIERAEHGIAVFARPSVLRGTTLWNVAAVLRATCGFDASEALERARSALSDVGLAAEARTDARSLSTGQRQRLALARALACEPRALFLDEPFANVDADGRPALRALVRAYVDRTGCALAVATSVTADAWALCREAVVLRAGAVTYHGPVAALATAHDPYVTALIAEGRAPGTA